MPHIHSLIDFTVSAYIVFENTVLLVHHKKIGIWVPPGGHVELDEDTDQALLREIEEETGLTVEIIGSSSGITDTGDHPTKALTVPAFMDIHYFDTQHRHLNMAYIARATSNEAVLDEREHHQLKWFTSEDLNDPQYNLTPFIKHYAMHALQIAGT